MSESPENDLNELEVAVPQCFSCHKFRSQENAHFRILPVCWELLHIQKHLDAKYLKDITNLFNPRQRSNPKLGGGFEYFLFSPLLGEDSKLN